MNATATTIQPGDVVRFRWHHPWNSWMDRWGPVTVERIDPDGKVWFRSPKDGGRVLPFTKSTEDIYLDQHETVEGEAFGIPCCTTCGAALASHDYPRNS